VQSSALKRTRLRSRSTPGGGNADKIAVVGLPDAAVRESKDRVTTAICNSALRWPSGKQITINLAPADVRKEGPSFDLPIALGKMRDVPIDKEADSILAREIPALCPSPLVLLEDVKRV
jgi:predicted ATPase with chaperone activity